MSILGISTAEKKKSPIEEAYFMNNTFGDINSPYFIFSRYLIFFGSVDEGSKRITLENYDHHDNICKH